MARLGEILLEKGVVSTDGLRSALEATRRNGGRLGTWLVRLGFISEATLLEALSEQTGCPPASALDLATAPADVRALIPPALAKRYMVVAFSRQGRNLDVAMVNPNDLLVVDEIAGATRHVVRPHVATEAALAAALAIPVLGPESGAPAPGPPQAAVREWRQFWRLESSGPELFRAVDAPSPAVPTISAAAFPDLTPLSSGSHAQAAAHRPLDLAEALATASHRDRVAELVLARLLEIAPRVALFSVHLGKVMGWAARGSQLVEEDFHTLILPLDRPSILLNIARGVDLHAGPVSGGEGNDLLLDALGPPTPKEAVIAPVRIRGRVVALIWLDGEEAGAATIPIGEVQEVARLTGLALEALLIKQKIRSAVRLTAGAEAD